MDSPGLSGCSPRDSGCYESSENLEHGNGHTDNYECAFISKPLGSFMTLSSSAREMLLGLLVIGRIFPGLLVLN